MALHAQGAKEMLAVEDDVQGGVHAEHDVEYELAGKGGKMGGGSSEGFERRQQRWVRSGKTPAIFA